MKDAWRGGSLATQAQLEAERREGGAALPGQVRGRDREVQANASLLFALLSVGPGIPARPGDLDAPLCGTHSILPAMSAARHTDEGQQ